jgi:hypothetical protein
MVVRQVLEFGSKRNAMKKLTWVGSMLVVALGAGCVSGAKATPAAALRSGCEASKVEVVRQEGHDVVLNVCGVYEDWRWHPLNGWEYSGPSSEQPLRAPVDADFDGVPDEVDACPATAGVSSLDPAINGCPPAADQDSDGVPDAFDKCPDVIGVAQADPAKNGCPPDADGDGVIDSQDACPDTAGVTNADPKKSGCPADADGDGVTDAADACPTVAAATANGCPPDADGDKVPDAADACPDKAGVGNADPASNGCPEGEKGTAPTAAPAAAPPAAAPAPAAVEP